MTQTLPLPERRVARGWCGNPSREQTGRVERGAPPFPIRHSSFAIRHLL